MSICCEVNTAQGEGSKNLLDNDLLMDVVEHDLSVKAYRAHQKLVQWTKTEAFHRSRMFVECANKLLGIHIMEAYISVVRDTSQSLFEKVTKLNLVDTSNIALLRLNLSCLLHQGRLFQLQGFYWVKEGFCVI
jgi:hypothetical protein